MGKYMTALDWKHSKFFRKEEFRCNCGKCSGYPKNGISKSLVDNMNLIRAIYGQSITITSGYRCPDFNKRVGGASNSAHLLGGACDWNFTNKVFSQKQKNEIISFIKKLPNYHYSYSNQSNMYNAIHYDTNLVECASWEESNVEALKKEIQILNDKIAELNKIISEKEIKIEELTNINENLEEVNNQYKVEIDRLNKEVDKLLKEIKNLSNEYQVLFRIFNLYVCVKKEKE